MTLPAVHEPVAAIAPRVLAALCVGKRHRQTAQEIERAAAVEVEWRSAFPVRQAIRLLISEGHAICSNGDGYWIAESEAEVDAYIDSLESRVAGIARRIDDLRRAKANLRSTQLRLPFPRPLTGDVPCPTT